MSRKKEEPSSFADAMGDVKPLADREKVAPPVPPSSKPPAPREAPRTRSFVVEQDGDWISGRAEDVSIAQLADLRAGRIPIDREIDLHGFRQDEAFVTLREQVNQARQAGARGLLVIHGWGRRSTEGAVLKDALPGWLQAEPFGSEVLAFATAPQAQGGIGATLVWLRRNRRG